MSKKRKSRVYIIETMTVRYSVMPMQYFSVRPARRNT